MTTDRRTTSRRTSVLIHSARAPFYVKGVPGHEELTRLFEKLDADRDSCREARTLVGTARGALEVADQQKRWKGRPVSTCVEEERLFRRTAFQAAKSKFVLHLWNLHRSWRDTMRYLEVQQPKASELAVDSKLNVVRVAQLLHDVKDALKDHDRYLKVELPDHADALHRQMEETSELHDLVHSDVAKSLTVMGMLVDQKVRTLPPIFYSLNPGETSGLAPLSAHVRDLLAATRAFSDTNDLVWNRLGEGTERVSMKVVLPTDPQDLCAFEAYRQRLIRDAEALEKARYLAAARRDAYLRDTREEYVYLQTEATPDVYEEGAPICDSMMHSIAWLNHALIRATYKLKRFAAYKGLLTAQTDSVNGKYEQALKLLKAMTPKS